MKLWPYAAILTFISLGIALKAWKSKKDLVFLARAWLLWGVFCVFAAAASSQFLKALPFEASLWLSQWQNMSWQLNFWMLSTGFGLIGFCRDLKADHGRFDLVGPALAWGFAVGPLVAMAFPLNQVVALLWPCLILAVALKIVRTNQPENFRTVRSVALLNVLGFLHGLLVLPAWLGALLMAAVLAFSLNPHGPGRGIRAMALGAIGIALKTFMGWSDPWWGPALICAFIFAGWFIFPIKHENPIAETP